MGWAKRAHEARRIFYKRLSISILRRVLKRTALTTTPGAGPTGPTAGHTAGPRAGLAPGFPGLLRASAGNSNAATGDAPASNPSTSSGPSSGRSSFLTPCERAKKSVAGWRVVDMRRRLRSDHTSVIRDDDCGLIVGCRMNAPAFTFHRWLLPSRLAVTCDTSAAVRTW